MWLWLLRLIGSLLAFLGAGFLARLSRSLRPELHHWSVLAGKTLSVFCSAAALALLVFGLLILLWPAPKPTEQP